VVQLRIVALLVALAFLGAAVAAAYFVFSKQLIPEKQAARELEQFHADPPPPPDPAVRVFAEAQAKIRNDDPFAAREDLLHLVEVYADSPTVPAAKQVIGEINLDQLLSRRPMPVKLDYLVKRGDVLSLIAKNHRTTVAYIQKVSPVSQRVIQPGDRLVLFPMEFDLTLDLAAGTLTLEHKGKFFHAYPVVEGAKPTGLKLPTKLQVSNRSASVAGELVGELDPRLPAADKWVQCKRPGSHAGLVFASESAPDGESGPLPNTVRFPDGAMEELYTILRPGLVVTVNE
jgi:LysM repeat protein